MNDRFLEQLDVLADCHAQTIELLIASTQERSLAAGEALFREGDPGDFFFGLRSGRLSVTKSVEARGPVQLRTLSPGESGGLTSMMTDQTRSATLQAVESSTVLLVPKAEFRRIMHERPDLADAVIAHLAGKVRGKTARIARFAAEEGDDRPAVAFFDTKRYDRASFAAVGGAELAFSFFEPKLSLNTVPLAEGFSTVCAFVNDVLDADVLRALAAGGVRHVALRCAGTNNVDLEAARELGIDVTRVPAYSPHAVAEHALALIMTLNRKVHRAHQRVREGNFSLAGLEGFDLYGRTAGVVGTGKIGQCFAEILRGLGMKVLAHDPYPDAAFAKRVGGTYVPLEELLQTSDIVSLHAPLTPDTHHMIDAAAIRTMKAGAMLINTSRGGLVDAEALIEGLKTGQVGAAGLDVYEEESEYFFEDRSDQVITDDVLARLLAFHNVIVTSHQAFLTREALSNIATTTVDNIREWLHGRRGDALSNAVGPSP